jgi:hypothetical protein
MPSKSEFGHIGGCVGNKEKENNCRKLLTITSNQRKYGNDLAYF